MQIIGKLDPSLGPDSFTTGKAAAGGQVVLHNLSGYDLLLQFGPDANNNAILGAWSPRQFDFCGEYIQVISYTILQGPANPQASPSTLIIGEAYAKGEPVPPIYPNYVRFANVGNTTLPSNATTQVSSTGLPPFSPLIDSTPNDQGAPSLNFTNDGSGLWNILSTGVLRQVMSILRGDNATEAQVEFGDPSDLTMTLFHGTADNAVQAGQAQSASTAQVANQVQAFDGDLGVTRQVTTFEGANDPTTWAVPAAPNEGDIWWEG